MAKWYGARREIGGADCIGRRHAVANRVVCYKNEGSPLGAVGQNGSRQRRPARVEGRRGGL
jgi:hypothetical protein